MGHFETEYIVWGWPWQIWARELESQAKFFVRQATHDFTMKLEHNTSIGVAMNPFGTILKMSQ